MSIPILVRRLPLLVLLWLGACAPVLQPAGPCDGPPRLEHGTFVTRDGLELPMRAWRPAGAPRAVMLGLHGFNDYSNAFALPGPKLAEAGIALYAYDQRGFGDTPHRGRWPGVAALVGDADDAVRLLRARHPGTPLYILGESMGGAVAMVLVSGGPAFRDDPPPAVDGVVLIAPAVWGREDLGVIGRNVLEFAAHTIPWYPLTGQGLNLHPSDNIAMLRAYAADPLVIKQTRIDAIYGVVNLMDAAVEAAPRFTVPALLVYGLKDDIIPKEATLHAIDALPAPPAGHWRLAVYENGYHMLLRDLERQRVIDDIEAWIADPAAPLPSKADERAVARLEEALE